MKLLVLLLIVAAAVVVKGLNNGVARTPPMGWLSWERFECRVDCLAYPDDCITEGLYKTMADHLVADGYAAVGYRYVSVDDCWMEHSRGPKAELVADKERFPSGMRALGDYLHAKGLLFGSYLDIGTMTCGGYPGSAGHFDQDAQQMAEWTVDSVKMDGCFANVSDYPTLYPQFGEALNRTGRPILYGCSWPAYVIGSAPFMEIAKHCNLWRAYNDIYDTFAYVQDIIGWWNKNQQQLIPAQGPGAWNDPDMIIGGNYGLSEDQAKLQMTVWSILAAPLFLAADLRSIAPNMAAILKNAEVIAVDQDPLGIQGTHTVSENNFDWWTKRLADGTTAVAVANFLQFGGPRHAVTKLEWFGMQAAYVRDLWNHVDLGLKVGSFDAYINPAGAGMYKLTPYTKPVMCTYGDGATVYDGDHLDTARCNSHKAFQQWLINDDDKTIRLANDLSLCLTVGPDVAPAGDGMALSLSSCEKPPKQSQLFRVVDTSVDDVVHIISAVNKQCLIVPALHSVKTWNSVNISPCDGSATTQIAKRQQWTIHVDNTIQSTYDGDCLTACHWDVADANHQTPN